MLATLRQGMHEGAAINTNGHGRPARPPALLSLGRWLGRTFSRWQAVRTAVMQWAAFLCITAAAWLTWGVAAGLVALGASLLVLETLSGAPPPR